MRRALLALAAVACLFGAPASSQAYEYGADFGFYDVNVPGFPTIPAFDGTKVIWAGTCDLTSGDTSNGGIGSAAAVRPHCMDLGAPPLTNPDPSALWDAGLEPSWRLRPVTQAGAHPDASVNFRFRRANVVGGTGFENGPEGNVKNIVVKLPVGVVGNPEVLPKCSAIEAQAVPPACGPETQAGISSLFFTPSSLVDRTQPVYNIEARDTVTAEFTIAYVSQIANVPITARGRTNSDYGVDTLALLIPAYLPVVGNMATFWGTPWAAEHDKFRVDSTPYFSTSQGNQAIIPLDGLTPAEGAQSYDPSWGPIRPFFTNPTSCSGTPPSLTIEADSWQKPVSQGGSFVSATAQTPPVTGCDNLEFDPAIELHPTVSVADSPAGLDVHLSIPQNNEPPAEALGNPNLPFDPADDTGAPAYWKTPAGLATAHLKDSVVTLPQGTSFNPAAANGLEGCTTEQVGLVSTNPTTFNNDLVRCPESSKIGTLQINTPLLPDPLFGAVYAAPQNDNPYPGSLTAIYLVAQDEERGLSIKLPGKVDLDPRTGQISTTFLENPQLPFDDFILHLKTGPRAPINTPPVCGHFENAADMVPWSFPDSGPQPTFHDPFEIAAMPNGLGCVTEPEDRVFAPGFEAGSTNTQAGSYTEFVMNVTREDGHQELSALNVDTPPGLSANLSETPFCAEGAIVSIVQKTGLEETQAPSCPPKSLVGVVDSLAGAGPLPLPTGGKLYFAGPYDPDGPGGLALAPLSIAAVVPAIAGGTLNRPAFDLGNLVVRSAIYVDPDDAGVHISAGRLPYIVGGVPLRVRKISATIDKAAFMLNPTNCSPLAIGGTIGGAADPLDPADDISVPASSRFQVGGCEKLGFKPQLKLKLIGATKRAANPRLRAELIPRPGDANLARAAVTLPHSAFLDQEHIDTICTRVQYAADQCPTGSIYGYAKAWTPLLSQPLEGPVYLRSSSNPLPDMVAALHGIIDLDIAGRVDSVNQSLRNTFDLVPDAPVSKFVLTLKGGKKGLIELSRNICAGKKDRATVRFGAQNGLSRNFRPLVANTCKGKARKGKGKQPGKAAKGKKSDGRR